MNDCLRAVRMALEAGQELVLATIVASGGSTPRGAGAAMAVRPDASIEGTVGGGLLEARAMRAAGELFAQGDGAAVLQRHELDNELAARADMVCGGQVTVLLERLDPGDAGVFAALDDALRQGRRAVLLTALEGPAGGPLRATARVALAPGQQPPPWPGHDPAALAEARDTALETGRPGLLSGPGGFLAVLPLVPQPAVFLFGAGHVSRPTAQVARIAGFRTVVLDDRPEFANRQRFPDADAVLVPPSMDRALDGLEVGEADSLVIVTRGHLHDKTVLAAALRTPARYVGMIGSLRKREAVYAALRDEGVPEAAIARCHCPIGLSIGARTPEEIAVSIVAELVQCRVAAEGGK
ncbi:XdhC family aldehyde oxidoreductase maturation factor [Desulfocurvus vexinensis]|uniref:XdhC family aldehyde oxidoreductase maturation factor n=1 Tax=Desulfocurvus vexinensis TaxID=399548 RepID=UPI00048F323A|nr:XdhC/CoxI family protein [Desulfocurvus vexinensis]